MKKQATALIRRDRRRFCLDENGVITMTQQFTKPVGNADEINSLPDAAA